MILLPIPVCVFHYFICIHSNYSFYTLVHTLTLDNVILPLHHPFYINTNLIITTIIIIIQLPLLLIIIMMITIIIMITITIMIKLTLLLLIIIIITIIIMIIMMIIIITFRLNGSLYGFLMQ